ncbi:unnamed protein product [Angiostrongylus costaricensis]|uniref:BREX-3 system P-loop-containing protein BrxF n=1 Tax=Angiostrongylus costaricensis TaxID=334426 RepID=A0A158PDJ5_ANGCS|nr:unnamed protein product [Angiostrongylus costaricensis]
MLSNIQSALGEYLESVKPEKLAKVVAAALVNVAKQQVGLSFWCRYDDSHSIRLREPGAQICKRGYRSVLLIIVKCFPFSADEMVELRQHIAQKALERHEKVEDVAHITDGKAMSEDALRGDLDLNTRQWSGLFSSIIGSQRIIFDGDVGTEWVEDLNLVADDNKLLMLPNGERLLITPKVRIISEVADLKNVSLGTFSGVD